MFRAPFLEAPGNNATRQRPGGCFHVYSCFQIGTWKQKLLESKGLGLVSTFPDRKAKAMIDLEAIFSDNPEAITWIVPGAGAGDKAPASEQAAGNPTTATDAPEAAPTRNSAAVHPDARVAPFPGWVLRPDATGRLGWEPPGLPEERRWWARATFDDLPRFPKRMASPGAGPCPWCGRREWWRSRTWPDVVRCGWCSPPVPGVPVERLNRSEVGPAGESIAQEPSGCVPAGSVDV